MAFLKIIQGPAVGQGIELDRDQMLLGRGADCDIVLASKTISRQHAQILRINNEYFLRDLNSSNSSYVNNQRVRNDVPTRLRDEDLIRIGDILFSFVAQPIEAAWQEQESIILATHPIGQPDDTAVANSRISESDQVWTQPMAATETRTLTSPEASNWSVQTECWRLRRTLTTNHVRAEYPSGLYAQLQQHLRDPDSKSRSILAKGFYRLILLDAAEGVDASGQFDLAGFLRHTVKQLVQAFNLDLPQGTYGPEDIAQILKDERRSLFCFLNAHLVPDSVLTRLRAFTQEMHQALMLCEIRLSQELDQLLPQILEPLFQAFPQADRGFIILCGEEQDKLIPVVVKTRRPHEEETARFNRNIVNKCLNSSQAFLVEDLTSDDLFDLSQSIAQIRIRSFMCVPLLGRNRRKPFGVIQLDTEDRSKRFTEDNLKRLSAVARQVAVTLENAWLREEQLARDRLLRDMELARRVQRSFLPKGLPEVPGYEFFGRCLPTQEVGGDYYDFIPLPEGRMGVVLGDAAGKGVSAARLMGKISSDVRVCLVNNNAPAAAVTALNKLINQSGPSDRFITLAVAVLDPSDHSVTLVNAGHCLPLIWRKGKGHLEEAMPREAAGFPLGSVDGYQYESCKLRLEPGDFILTFTDGITEAKNKQAVDFQIIGVEKAVLRAPCTPRAVGERLVEAVKQHSQGCKQHDDITVVCFGRL
jgi:serine phosphatase RsbU (regulator of sigma subunit)/pSer/pThr/pTyr-binding forkhead associated (FHA) protein